MISLVSTDPTHQAVEVIFRGGALFCTLQERVTKMEALMELDFEEVISAFERPEHVP